MIIPLQCDPVVGVRSHNANRTDFPFIQRQDTVIFQKYHSLVRRFHSQVSMFLTLHNLIWNIIVFTSVEHSQKKTGGKHTDTGFGDLFFRHQSVLQCSHDICIGASTVQVTSRFQCHLRGLFRSVCNLMELVEILDCPAVRYHMSLKSPVFPKNFFQ